MPSTAKLDWTGGRAAELDQLEVAHSKMGGSGPGRRYTTQQVNQAYVMLLSSHFQGYCRDLHSEAVAAMTASMSPPQLMGVFQVELTRDRKLSRGNPSPGNIGADFGRLGLALWQDAYAWSALNRGRNRKLEELNTWRNAIAHQDFDPQKLGGRTQVALWQVRSWRQACNGLVATFDQIVAEHILAMVGSRPW